MVLETDDKFFHIFALKTNLIHGDKQGKPTHTHTHRKIQPRYNSQQLTFDMFSLIMALFNRNVFTLIPTLK